GYDRDNKTNQTDDNHHQEKGTDHCCYLGLLIRISRHCILLLLRYKTFTIYQFTSTIIHAFHLFLNSLIHSTIVTILTSKHNSGYNLHIHIAVLLIQDMDLVPVFMRNLKQSLLQDLQVIGDDFLTHHTSACLVLIVSKTGLQGHIEDKKAAVVLIASGYFD